MKQATLLTFLFFSLAACAGSRQAAGNQGKSSETTQSPKDSTLAALQRTHDVLLVFAENNSAWTRTTRYQILAKKSNEWKGYNYEVYNAKIGTGSKLKTGLSEVAVSFSTSDSVFQYFIKNGLVKSTGDSGKNFCEGGTAGTDHNCNITDATTWKLMMITPGQLAETSYYAPEFFETCCPGNVDRKNFVNAAKKIMSLVGNGSLK